MHFHAVQGANVGGGCRQSEEIRVRLHAPGASSCFLPFCLLRIVLLHELAHNLRGAHDEEFYRLLEELCVVGALLTYFFVFAVFLCFFTARWVHSAVGAILFF
jgi:WLM domain